MSFALDLNKFAAKAGANADKVVRKVCFDLAAQVIQGTPVDTGRARGNWQASLDRPREGSSDATDRSGAVTIAAAGASITNAPGRIFYLTNNLPYIYRLEYLGWSQQAPTGWVRASVERVRASLA